MVCRFYFSVFFFCLNFVQMFIINDHNSWKSDYLKHQKSFKFSNSCARWNFIFTDSENIICFIIIITFFSIRNEHIIFEHESKVNLSKMVVRNPYWQLIRVYVWIIRNHRIDCIESWIIYFLIKIPTNFFAQANWIKKINANSKVTQA